MYIFKTLLCVFVFINFSACFSDDEKKKNRRIVKIKQEKAKHVNLMLNKIKQINDSNKSLVEQIEEDGIIVDGARDEELLDAFNMAVSQVMTQEGVSVPDCDMLASTEYLSKNECDEISEKYFGFYDIYNLDGEMKKVDDVFAEGIVGDVVEIRDDEIKYFDSSGNPLLDNQIEFDELIDSSNDLDMLEDLEARVNENKEDMKNRIKLKIKFLKDIKNSSSKNIEIDLEKKEIEEYEQVEQKITNKVEESYDSNGMTQGQCLSKSSSLRNLKIKLKQIELQLEQKPEDSNLIDYYNIQISKINELEAEVAGC